MIVVAIIGILAAISIPQYSNYIKHTKVNACIANSEIAFRYVQNEIAKVAAGEIADTNMVATLNQGGKTEPYRNLPAYKEGTTAPSATAGSEICQIGISTKTITGGSAITITGVEKSGDSFAAPLLAITIPVE